MTVDQMKQRRFLHTLGFFLFAAVLPIVAITLEFDLYHWVSQSSSVIKWTGAGVASMAVVAFALRRRIASWIDDMEPQPLKTVFKAVGHLAPYIALLLFMGIVKDHINTLYYVFAECIASNIVAVYFEDRIDHYNYLIKREKDKDKLREVLSERGL